MEPLQGVLMRSAEGVRSLSKTRHGTLLKSISKASRGGLWSLLWSLSRGLLWYFHWVFIGMSVGWSRERFVVVPECSLEDI